MTALICRLLGKLSHRPVLIRISWSSVNGTLIEHLNTNWLIKKHLRQTYDMFDITYLKSCRECVVWTKVDFKKVEIDRNTEEKNLR